MKSKLNHWPVYDKCIKILSCVLNTAKALVKLQKKKKSRTHLKVCRPTVNLNYSVFSDDNLSRRAIWENS